MSAIDITIEARKSKFLFRSETSEKPSSRWTANDKTNIMNPEPEAASGKVAIEQLAFEVFCL